MGRGEYGAKIYSITERAGLPLPIGIVGADIHDSQVLTPLVKGVPPVRSRRGPGGSGPRELHAEKGYDYDHLRPRLSGRGIEHRIARGGIESPIRPDRRRTVGRTMSWLAGRRRLRPRHERRAEHFLRCGGAKDAHGFGRVI